MSFSDSIQAFIEGIKSVIDVSGAIQNTISIAISDGIESAFKSIQKPLEKTIMRVSLILVSLFLIVWGAGMFLDSFLHNNGLGFVIIGAIFGILVVLFLN